MNLNSNSLTQGSHVKKLHGFSTTLNSISNYSNDSKSPMNEAILIDNRNSELIDYNRNFNEEQEMYKHFGKKLANNNFQSSYSTELEHYFGKDPAIKDNYYNKYDPTNYKPLASQNDTIEDSKNSLTSNTVLPTGYYSPELLHYFGLTKEQWNNNQQQLTLEQNVNLNSKIFDNDLTKYFGIQPPLGKNVKNTFQPSNNMYNYYTKYNQLPYLQSDEQWDLTLPGHNYLGPGTNILQKIIADAQPTDLADTLALRHDVAYATSTNKAQRLEADYDFYPSDFDTSQNTIFEIIEAELASEILTIKADLNIDTSTTLPTEDLAIISNLAQNFIPKSTKRSNRRKHL